MNKNTMRRHIRLGMLLVTVVLSATSARAWAPAGSAVSCGLGLPPDAPGFAQARAEQARAAHKNGYVSVCDANLDRYRIPFKPLTTATAQLAFQPVDLAGTPFAGFASLGGASETVNDVRSRLYRGFRTPQGHTVTLMEHDMSADGSVASRDPQDEPERVHGLPARLNVFQTPSGKAISHLSWLEGRRWYELWIDANVGATPLRAQLFALAAALPVSTPACPNERLPAPPRMGADGFPIFESAPNSMTLADMDAVRARPCK